MKGDKIWKVELYEKKELPSGTPWTSYNIVAESALEAIEKAEIAAKDEGLGLIAGSCNFVLEVDI
jgi:hypothetical protein